ncbi:putative site-specific recombinase [Oscillibacter valericigenes Sjm18-20]|nr:putative site-specific recombinase [Oscillibacter valericigenes Sjm18-20]
MANQKYNILYGRLSQEDELKGDSNSIQNQRMLLEKYAQENGFANVKFLYDDGDSGINFNRPVWNDVMRMIENGEVETLIVKDLSRLDREYLQVGYYTEIYFPQKGVPASLLSMTVSIRFTRKATISTDAQLFQ